jgi:hypothetical protein
MAEGCFDLPTGDRREALLVAAHHLGRPADLVEKDVYVTWSLSVIEQAPWGNHVVFKGGTSLSKAHRVIDRFSEDVDLTYDARAMAPDVVGDGWPSSRSQADRWARSLRERLAGWVMEVAAPHFRASAIADEQLRHAVAAWKGWFFREPGVDYASAVRGSLRLVPAGASRTALADDYADMVASGLVNERAPTFDEVLAGCAELERAANANAHR